MLKTFIKILAVYCGVIIASSFSIYILNLDDYFGEVLLPRYLLFCLLAGINILQLSFFMFLAYLVLRKINLASRFNFLLSVVFGCLYSFIYVLAISFTPIDNAKDGIWDEVIVFIVLPILICFLLVCIFSIINKLLIKPDNTVLSDK